jgi:glycosyltransferase involved in cell wall biosynthesis
MQIVFLNPSGRMGGGEAALLNIRASVREAAPDWKLDLIVSEDGPLAAKAKLLGVSTCVLAFPPSLARLGDSSAGGPAGKSTARLSLLRQLLLANNGIRAYAASLRKVLRQLAPDVIHTNGFKMHILGALAKPKPVPLIWHVHDYVQPRPFMARLMRLFQRRCKIALANSNSVALDIKTACGNSLPVQTIYNGIDTTDFSPLGDRLDLDLLSGLPPATPGIIRVGMLATLARWKGHEVLLRALALISPEIPMRGYIIGDALYQTDGSQYSLAELRAIAVKLGVSDRVGFAGFVDQPAAAMRSLDIVVHASTEPEPFGLVIVEAMACGRAVIASDAGGAAELFENNVTALGHAPGDATQLAERITQLATNPDLRKRLGAAGRATVEQRFDRGRLAKDLIPIYRAAIPEAQNVSVV